MKKLQFVPPLSIPTLLAALGLIVLINIGLSVRVSPTTHSYEATVPITVSITSPAVNTVYTWKDTVTATATVAHTNPLTSVEFQYSTTGGWKRACVFKKAQDVYTCSFPAPYTGTNKTPAGVNDGFALAVYGHDIMTNTNADMIQLWSHK